MEEVLEGLKSLELTEKEAKTYIAMMDFIIINSARNDLESEILIKELIDLGIPKENCVSFGKVYSKNKQRLRSLLQECSLRSKNKIKVVNNIDDIKITKKIILKSGSSSKKGLQYADVQIRRKDNLGSGENRLEFSLGMGQLKEMHKGKIIIKIDLGEVMELLKSAKK